MTISVELVDEGLLHQAVEQMLPVIGGRPSTVVSIHRQRSSYASWYASEIITATLSTGVELTCFLKNFGSFRQPKPEMELRRERELRVYRELLAPAQLGTPQYYGEVWDAAAGRFWLLMECVPGTLVRYCDFPAWVAAAGWLGRMHGYFAQRFAQVTACAWLARHDADFFRMKAELALQAVSSVDGDLTRRLKPIVSRYESIVSVMASPNTLVHGAYKSDQILFDDRDRPPRVCPVDWELAAVGSGFYDLACLIDGFKSARFDRCLAAYRQEISHYDIPLPDDAENRYLINCFRLHRLMNWISRSQDRRYAAPDLAKLVDAAEQISRLVVS